MLMMLMYWEEACILNRKKIEALIVASKETGLEVNADETKDMVMSRDQNAGRRHNVKVDNRLCGRAEQFKYLGTILTNQNYIQEEIKSRLKSGNACSHAVRNLLFSSLLSKNTKVKIYRTVILPVVLYGCETWSLTLMEERTLRVFENRVLRRIFGHKRDEITEEWRKLHNEVLNDLYCSPNIVRVMKSRRMRWTGHVARRVWGRVEVHTEFSWGNLREGDHLEDPGLDERMILNASLGSGMWEFRLDRAGSG